MLMKPGNIEFLSDQKKIKELEDEYCEKQELSTELKGTPAFEGKLKGKAKILMTSLDNSKVEKGDILIAPMTTPDMVPAMNVQALEPQWVVARVDEVDVHRMLNGVFADDECRQVAGTQEIEQRAVRPVILVVAVAPLPALIN